MRFLTRHTYETQKAVIDRENIILSSGMFYDYCRVVSDLIFDDGYIGLNPFGYECAFVFRSQVSKEFIDKIKKGE